MPALIELDHVSKRFAGIKALDDVSLSVAPGEIHCLAGENGSGKSTIIKVMSGVYRPDGGMVRVDGQPVAHMTPASSVAAGIQVIYQDLSLFGNLSVAENLAMNKVLKDGRRAVRWSETRRLARTALDRLGVDLPLDVDVETLPTAGRQLVAIARALLAEARLLIMDEPTTALTRNEVERLLEVTRTIQRDGIAVLFVSHKMREMLEISERLTVMRNGRVVVEGPITDFTEASITRHMTGRDLGSDPYPGPTATAGPPRLAVKGLTVPGAVAGVDLTLHPGEILGLCGLIGAGRTELALALFGMRPDHTGMVEIDGQAVTLGSVADAIRHGIAYVPEDRLSEGLFLSQSVARNMLASSLDAVSNGVTVDRGKAAETADAMIAAMQIATRDRDTPVGNLSGGNQQRVVIARWLLTKARILILNGPTVGVDVGSKAEIHRVIRDLARTQGLAVLMISDDVPELLGNCNAVALMHRGRLVERFDPKTAGEDDVSDALRRLR
ncbi:sugar ABC transporter ATP-binding protein [Lichenihabitans sp. Uapishka_5]|uniref:sugar ABC transporter ATP-binding protein n=1 Tax=Lichenihabitans sp. Uapishka_5 TaxID=3037302 RepID=UPI0029E7F917|nr:sugar ABC transporter ATP-binding protein [Lichenihabitans sp. Uapishka_5]MDX7951041.1 sugar ABC transporter ATP-binding protein [Lichenihabitans sp. Uapishka_5]